MDITIYIVGAIFALFFLWFGYTKQNFPSLYLSFFTIIILGLMLGQNGVSLESGSIITETATNTIIETTYETHTTSNWIVNLIHLVFMMGGTVMVILSTIFVITER